MGEGVCIVGTQLLGFDIPVPSEQSAKGREEAQNVVQLRFSHRMKVPKLPFALFYLSRKGWPFAYLGGRNGLLARC